MLSAIGIWFAKKGLTEVVMKNAAIIIVALLICFAGWYLVHVIEANARKDLIIETQTLKIDALNLALVQLERISELKDRVIVQRDDELRALEDDIENITNDLGDDAEDQAAESLKELFRRLK